MVKIAHGNPAPEGNRGEDSDLVERVQAFYVGGRIGLGIAERLRGGQRLCEIAVLARHPGEDVVGGAVDDAHDPLDGIARQ